MYWAANLETARWAGTDLMFSATTDIGVVRYLIRARCLEGAAQRSGTEVLHSNLIRLKDDLARRAVAAQPGDIVTVE